MKKIFCIAALFFINILNSETYISVINNKHYSNLIVDSSNETEQSSNLDINSGLHGDNIEILSSNSFIKNSSTFQNSVYIF